MVKKPTRRRAASKPATVRGTVDDYIASRRPPLAKVLRALRELIHSAAPGITESIKWGQPVYELGGPVCYLKTARGHVNFGFWRGSDLPDPDQLLEGTGVKMRHVKVASIDDIRRQALGRLVRAAVKLNREHAKPKRPA